MQLYSLGITKKSVVTFQIKHKRANSNTKEQLHLAGLV